MMRGVKQAPIIYHRGSFLPYADAGFEIQDRGVLFADGVYEVVRYDRGRAFGMRAHLDRLTRSLEGIQLAGVDVSAIAEASDQLMQRNQLQDAKVYWQVTRGPAARDFVCPDPPDPSVTLIAFPMPPLSPDPPLDAGSAILVDDCRWTRCWIKSLMLLPASLAKTQAQQQNAIEAIFSRAKPGHDQPHVTEGASTNVFIVRDGQLLTHPDDGWILGGITRQTLLRLAHDSGLPCRDDQPFTPDTLRQADEVFVCSTTQFTAITAVDRQPIADGRPGPVTAQLHAAYHHAILHPASDPPGE